MKFGLKEKNILQINSIFIKYPQVDKAIIYGSRAKGDYKNGSDIDLTLIGNDLNLKLLNKIRIELDDLNLVYSLDISIYEQISNPDLIDHIERVGIVFYKRGNI